MIKKNKKLKNKKTRFPRESRLPARPPNEASVCGWACVRWLKNYLCDCLQCAVWDRKGFWNTGRSCWIYIRLTGIRPFIQQLNESHNRAWVLTVWLSAHSWSLRDCAPPPGTYGQARLHTARSAAAVPVSMLTRWSKRLKPINVDKITEYYNIIFR